MNFSGILLVFSSFIIFSCQDIEKDFYKVHNIPETSGKEVFDGDPEPLKPPLEEGIKDLYGVDSDNDGVRDDVEIWINRNLTDAPKRKYFKGKAKYLSNILRLTIKGHYRTKQNVDEVGEYSVCGPLAFTGGPNDAILIEHYFNKKFDPVFFNTSLRSKTHHEYMVKGEIGITTSSPQYRRYKEISETKCPWDKETNDALLKKFFKGIKNPQL